MKKYIFMRILRSIVSIFLVTTLTYAIIYTMVPRRLIFKQDPNYNKIATNKDKKTIEEDNILENMEEEIEQMEKDEESEKPSEASQSPEVDKTKDILTKTLADFDNYKKRVERDKKDMIFFLKSDILKKILPRVDDLERIIKNTPKDFQENIVFE